MYIPFLYEVLMAVRISIYVFQDITSWNLVDEYQCLGGTCYLHLQG